MRYIAFDFDGTIVDSSFAICEAMERACIRHGAQYVGDSELKKHIGQDLEICIQNATSENLSDEKQRGVARSYRETFKYELVKPFVGMKEVFQECTANDDRLAIATTRKSHSLDTILLQNQIDHYFEYKVCSNHVTKLTQHANMLEMVLHHFQCLPQELFYVGDTIWDIELAVKLGAVGIGVTWGTHSEKELLNAGASITLDTTEELQKFFAASF